LKLEDLPVRDLGELDGVFAAMSKERGGSLFVETQAPQARSLVFDDHFGVGALDLPLPGE
jgi:hypothetical protein